MRRAILLLNGPPNSGKDTIGNIIVSRARELFNVKAMKFAEPLKMGGLSLVGEIPTIERAEVLKELTLRDTIGIDSDERHRDFWIWLSEEVLKPKYGKDFFGRILANKMKKCDARLFVVTDSGFDFEAGAVGKEFGFENVYQIKLVRDGYSFLGDSRSYWYHPQIQSLALRNEEGQAEQTAKEILHLFNYWIKERVYGD